MGVISFRQLIRFRTNVAIIGAFLALSFFTLPIANAAITFEFDYSDNDPGVGFLDVNFGQARQNALTEAANLFGAYFANYDAHITYKVTSIEDAASNTLASAGTSFSTSTPGFISGSMQNKILNNDTVPSGTNEGIINWNFGKSWDLDDNISSGSFDFKSIAMHELIHTVGFISLINSDGSSKFDTNFNGNADVYTSYDAFLVDRSGNALIDNNFEFAGNVSDLTGGTGSDGVFFDGATAVTANGGDLVNIYSPSPFSSGSSLSHLDDQFYTSQSFISEAFAGTGSRTRLFSDIEIGILRDIGYTDILTSAQVAAVPEPTVYWMLLLGLGVLGFTARKHNA